MSLRGAEQLFSCCVFGPSSRVRNSQLHSTPLVYLSFYGTQYRHAAPPPQSVANLSLTGAQGVYALKAYRFLTPSLSLISLPHCIYKQKKSRCLKLVCSMAVFAIARWISVFIKHHSKYFLSRQGLNTVRCQDQAYCTFAPRILSLVIGIGAQGRVAVRGLRYNMDLFALVLCGFFRLEREVAKMAGAC
ncbi:hypothetical protein B9Z19DRAFT_1096918 [Tuber borchii]|uniref:Uncharacterized protein n=1 Tax=Tuber borchii TaxID=42251 RepID=A0A2T6ZAW2_TUBBO|nr:hypothetical protein B9Z19DRAFT_1096918 [Tuber borchii]